MKVTATLAALSLGLASVGLAQAADLTRAEVVQQLHEAQAQGLVTIGEQGNYPVESAPSTLSRSEVVNALRLAQAQGQVEFGEQAHYPQARSEGAAKTRARRLGDHRRKRALSAVIARDSAGLAAPARRSPGARGIRRDTSRSLRTGFVPDESRQHASCEVEVMGRHSQYMAPTSWAKIG